MKGTRKVQGLFDAHRLNIVLALSLLASLAGPARAGQTSTYVFLADQSTVVETGGFAGVNETHPIQGQFQLEVDVKAAVASFGYVDAFLLSPVSSSPPQSLGEVFNMTGLAGVIIDGTTIRFEGTAGDGSTILITLTFLPDDTVTLKGQTTPPPNSADFFVFTLDAVAEPSDGGETRVPAWTGTYVFDPARSTVLQTGGIAGIHRTYTITGTFQLTLDFETGTAWFDRVDARAVYSGLASRAGPPYYSLDPNDVFNMTDLAGTIADDGESIRFEGMADDGSSIQITLTLADGSVSLKGETVPPPGSADFFMYTLDALAEPKYEYGAGSGTADDPYQIATAADLIALSKGPDNYDKHFILTADIDLDPNLPGRRVFDRAVIAPAVTVHTHTGGHGVDGTPFSGIFDGNGHTVSHLTIMGAEYLGLFGYLGFGAEVKDLGVVDANVTGSDILVGGLAGWNDGEVIQCYITGSVSGDWYVGGLVGENHYGSITTCYSIATVSGWAAIGGLVGVNYYGSVTTSYSTGLVSAPGGGAGGLVGWNSGRITTSHSVGTVTGTHRVGGLAGEHKLPGSITDSYSTCAVHGDITVGGLVGYNPNYHVGSEKPWYGRITNCYSSGTVSGSSNVGGLLGLGDANSVVASFWDTQSSGQITSAGGIGKTTVEMQTAGTFLETGWDFVGETANGTEDIWSICEGTNYPRLTWQVPAGDFVCPDGITIEDIVFFMEHWLNDNCDSSNDWCDGTDLDRSGAVDVDDLEILLDNWPADSE
ncbi:MAG: GLUG motif-containing protein [Planctomycetota bacterium]|jgi:hypothetical protein